MTMPHCHLMVSTPGHSDRAWQSEPVTAGVPLPRGLVPDTARLRLTDDRGSAVPLQAIPLERWPDGSVRWALLDFALTGPPAPERRYTLSVSEPSASIGFSRLTIDRIGDSVAVDTGVGRFQLRPGVALPFAHATVGGSPPIDGAMSALLVTSANGVCQPAQVTRVTVEESGDLRTTVRLDGAVGPRRRPWVQLLIRIQFFAGSGAVRMAVTLRNPRRARHPGGIWELGDPGSIFLRDVSLRLQLPATAATIECSTEFAESAEVYQAPVVLYQDSSGGENWRHVAHVNRHGDVPCTFRGYRLTSGAHRREGLRATPAVVVRHAHGSAGVAVEHFWQNFPKAIAAESTALVVGLFPEEFADRHELQGGEQKTHHCTLMFGDDPSARDARFWGRTPAILRATPSWYCSSGAVPHLSPAAEDADPRYRRLVGAAIEGGDSFERKRETIDEYGWRNFGDIYADHENVFAKERGPIVSHYNNQYDAVAGFAYQFMRTGDARWYRLMTELATHVTDIDIYHTDRDKSAYNHGLFWHTAHYQPAGRSSHRTYTRAPGVSGGGPSNEHNYTGGLRLHWLLTGDRQSRDAALGLAEWVIAMDDGRKHVLRWLSTADTGFASLTQSLDFQGPGRGAGHSILALLDGHRLTEDTRFLAKAEQLIRRCVHPSDDIAALNLLDAERRWSYTVFLQVLGKYLDYKLELDQLDGSYVYARAALLHYARWMAEHEYPYLDKPEILEYPTETWAAQDMRKCEVFLFASSHAAGIEKERFLERAGFFFDYSLSTLLQAETRSLARPVVLLLTNGPMALASRRAAARPAPLAHISEPLAGPRVFVPQKARAKKRIAATAAAAMFVALATITYLSAG